MGIYLFICRKKNPECHISDDLITDAMRTYNFSHCAAAGAEDSDVSVLSRTGTYGHCRVAH